jgi:hypothetical protein
VLSFVIFAAVGMAAPICPDGSSLDAFKAFARDGERAFAEMDLLALTRSRDAALAVIPCISEPVPVPVAADFHRLMALAAFTAGRERRVLAEFHAARRLVPGYEVPRDVVPEGHPLLALYAASTTADEGELDAAIPPLGGWVVVDGIRGATRPQGISTIVQAFGSDGALVESRYLAAGEPTPAWGPHPLEVEQRRRRRRFLSGVTGVTLVTSATLYGLAWSSRAHFDDTNAKTGATDAQLDAVRTKTNAYTVASAATAVAAVGFGTLTVFAW